jgi:hypothetical protein
MSDCIHCDIHDLIEEKYEGQNTNLAELTGKVAEVLVDLILLAPVEQRGSLMADILANIGGLFLEKSEDAGAKPDPRRH